MPALPTGVADLGDRRRRARARQEGGLPAGSGRRTWPRCQLLARLQVQRPARLRRRVRDRASCANARPTRKRERRQYSFDDMIAGLHAAVDGSSASGPILAASCAAPGPGPWWTSSRTPTRCSTRIPRAHLRTTTGDEPQGGHGLILIGDPKQAIYGFRGGDVFAYLDAARGRARRATAWTRTSARPPARAAGPRRPVLAGGEQRIRARRHRASSTSKRAVAPATGGSGSDGDELPGVTAWSIPADIGAEKKHVQPALEAATVTRIAELLDGERADVQAAADRRAVRPGDIAVLVNSNREAADMQSALVAAGVPAVCIHQHSVFATEAAHHLLLLLRAAAVPFDARRGCAWR
ncbi:MAG: UvrD-helicase domain-containing protein [Halofilum sp. (in: g-proteobacteria)]|nr:UvrD-helicase domain-containing protein [Halofilum sp. (in: g-proteobacteria)]